VSDAAIAGVTHITVVLDSSGSMDAVAEDTIGGFNRFLADQQHADCPATITLVLFDGTREVVYTRKPVAEAPRLTRETYHTGGGTALLDAIGDSIAEAAREIKALPEQERPAKIIFVILTDGQENSSGEYTRDQVFKTIRERQEQHGWQFVFLGANQDAILEGGKFGIDAGNSLTFEPTGEGAQSAFNSASKFVQTFATLAGPPPSFSDADRKAQERLARQRRKQRPSKN
jgi:hypothetical protein